jgi:acetyl esterase/lipase
MNEMTRRDFGLLAGAGTLALADAAGSSSAAISAVPFDITPYVAPELRPMVPSLQQLGRMMASRTSSGPGSAAQMPEMSPALAQMVMDVKARSQPLPEPAWSERTVSGPGGAPDIRILVIHAATGASRPAILHVHGGGYISGAARDSIRTLQEMALALDCVIVSVDYRLAPGTHFPGSLEDNYAALIWLYRSATELGVDRSRIAVMGESSGGGHAAMLAITARDRGDVPIVYQALIYPMLDDRTGSSRNVPPPMGQLIWAQEQNVAGWTALLGVPAGSAKVPDGAVPARVADLKGLPPTFIGVGSIDLLATEDIEYGRRLIELGTSVEMHIVPGAFHGFDRIVPNTEIAKRFRATLTGALMRAFQSKA